MIFRGHLQRNDASWALGCASPLGQNQVEEGEGGRRVTIVAVIAVEIIAADVVVGIWRAAALMCNLCSPSERYRHRSLWKLLLWVGGFDSDAI
jgi:hypothetical protein